MDKIIFLDIDGVLNCVTDNIPSEYLHDLQKIAQTGINDRCASVLNNIIKKTNAKIVISSSWRTYFSLDELKEIFKYKNIKATILGITPSRFSNYDRGQEIRWWLEDHYVKSYVIIDDTYYYGFKKPELNERFLYIEDGDGLRYRHIKPIINILNNPLGIN